jgi:hypothetical protein
MLTTVDACRASIFDADRSSNQRKSVKVELAVGDVADSGGCGKNELVSVVVLKMFSCNDLCQIPIRF